MKSRARRAVPWLVVLLALFSISLLAFPWTKEAGAEGSIVANAGKDRVGVGFNAAVTLDGTQSKPSPEGGAVRCRWKQLHGTPVTLSDPDSCAPTFATPPANAHLETYWYLEGPGTVNRSRRGIELTTWRVIPFSRRQKVLEFELTVMDDNTIEGEGDELLGTDTVTTRVFIDPNNGAGKVSGGQNTVAVGTRVYLNGATSEGAGTNWSSSLTTPQVGGQDGTNDAVTGWSWTLAERPAGSLAQLQNPLTQTPILVPDVEGRYVINYAVTAVGDIPEIYLDLNGNGRRGGDGLITDSPGSMVLMAARWVGVGGVGGVTPGDSQCAGCHNRPVVTQDSETLPPILPLWKKTGHASILQKGLDGLEGNTYRESCIACHSVGFNPDPQAQNGGWDDLARGRFRFPKRPQPGTFRKIVKKTPDLAQRAGVQCENCHGPGSKHRGDPEGITRSQDPTVCAQCHDAPDQGYNIFQQYRNGRMGYDVHVLTQTVGIIAGFSPCQKCHSSQGFIQMTVKGLDPIPIDNPARVGCPTCHDPHDATNRHQFRIANDSFVELFDGTLVSGREGTVCMTCHRMPIVVIKNPAGVMGYIDAYLAGATVIPDTTPPTPISDAFILLRTMPTNTEMLAGTGGYEFPGERYARSFHYANPNTCVTCHMFPSPGPGQPGHNRVGGHTFNVRSPEELTGTRINEEGGERVENVAACQQCHANLKTFNRRARGDYDGDGRIEGVQDEIVGLIALVKAAPGYFTGTITRSTPLAQVAARWNVVFVEQDKSRGIHNTAYAVTLLQRSYKKLTGNEIPRADVIFKREPYSTTP